MSLPVVLSPVFTLILLTFVLFGMMGASRAGVVRTREVKIRDVALGNEAWPPRVKQISNAFHNQLEMPVLFYALVPLVILANRADVLFVIMSWIFVLARIAHAYVHVTSNYVPLRFNIFLVGAVVLALMWIIFAAQVMLGL